MISFIKKIAQLFGSGSKSNEEISSGVSAADAANIAYMDATSQFTGMPMSNGAVSPLYRPINEHFGSNNHF